MQAKDMMNSGDWPLRLLAARCIPFFETFCLIFKGSQLANLREFIKQRQREIRDAIELLRNEEQELRAALAAIDDKSATQTKTSTNARMTIKEMIINVLTDNVAGGQSDDLIKWINIKYGTMIPRTSMSPQLSRLKADGTVILDQSTKIWRLAKLADRVSNENEAPKEGASDTREEATSHGETHADQAQEEGKKYGLADYPEITR